MKKATINNVAVYYEVFIANADPFILLSNDENASEGISKIYFLRKYSIKFAMEDFLKYVDKVKEYKAANEVR